MINKVRNNDERAEKDKIKNLLTFFLLSKKPTKIDYLIFIVKKILTSYQIYLLRQ